jgi:protein ImuB
LAGNHQRKRVLLAVDAAAIKCGLHTGMTLTKAQILVPDLVIAEADPAADQEALEKLALWMLQRYAPIVATDPPNGIVIDCTGADHLHGGENAMLSDIVTRLGKVGVAARCALADTWGTAYALARFTAQPTINSAPGLCRDDIARLPLAALRLPPKIVEKLCVLGFEIIADILAQPRAPLTLRFGPEIGRRIDQALGTSAEPITPIRSPDIVEVRRSFAEPIGAAETIARYIGKLTIALCDALEQKGLGAKCLDLVCHRVDNSAQAIRIGTAQPVRDAKRLTRLLCDKIETIDPGFGIETLSLTATGVEPIAHRQHATSLIERPEADISDLIDTLANRIGENRIYRVAPVPTDVPERSITRVPALSEQTGTIWPGHWPRPSRLLAKPEPIEAIALLPDHPPASFTWRGNRRRVRRADGPERVFGEWWKRDAELEAVRDYFRVEDDAGERYWIFRVGDGEDPATGSHRWFLHGVFG